MKYSIIVGVYNQIATLPALVESFNKQTVKDFEVHFCDDGSDDGSYEWLLEAQKWDGPLSTFPSFVHRQEHKGMRLARNINQGIRAARGEFCVFVMADSMLETDYLEILNGFATAHRMVCGMRIQLDTVNGELIGVDLDWRVKKGLVPEVAAVVLGQPWGCLTGNGLTIPTWALREYGGWDEKLEGYGGEDNDIVARLFYKGLEPWSVPQLRLYHHWHKSRESEPKNIERFAANLRRYERGA